MVDESWIKKLMFFIPKSLLNAEKIWDEELETYAIKVYKTIYICIPDYSYYMFYYNISKKQYNIVLYTSERGDSYGTFCEDMDDFDFACAAFIYKITDRYDLSWERKKNESFDDWRNRRIMYADDLFVEINKYFEMKEAYKPHLYRYAGILKNVDEAIPYKKGIL